MATSCFLLAVATILLQLFILSCEQDHSTSSFNYRYPKGILPCKFYNGTKLDCAGRNLTSVPDLPPSTTHVYLSKNAITTVNQTQFSGHKCLQLIYLQYNKLGFIPENTFTNITLLDTLILSTAGITDISLTAFTGLFKLRRLNLSFNFLKHLPADIFKDLLDLQDLDLKNNLFSLIPDRALGPLQSLQLLDITRSLFTSFSLGEGFRNLTNLEFLLLHSSNVSEVKNDTFENVANAPLIYLFFTWDTVPETTIDNGILIPLKHIHWMQTFYEAQDAIPYMETDDLRILQIFLAPPGSIIMNGTLEFISRWSTTLSELDLDFSYISGLYGSPFMFFTNLTILHISWVSHSMQFISDEAFYGLENLQELYLAGNGMNRLPVDAFAAFNKTRSLRLLDLSANSLKGFFDPNAFEAISSLQELHLSRNPLRYIGDWIHVLTNLETLHLNKLTSLIQLTTDDWTMPLPLLREINFNWPEEHKIIQTTPLAFFRTAPQLQTLSLKGTYVKEMASTFGLLKNLRNLDLTQSIVLVQEKEKVWRKGVRLPIVENLNLASNELHSAIEMEFNVTTPNVMILDLNDNYIRYLDRDTFTSLQNLRFLDIGNNGLGELDGIVHLYNLVHLNISHNSIIAVPEEFVDLVNASDHHLIMLDLSGNPFDCTCAIVPFVDWIRTDNLVKLVPNEMYKCNTPKNLKEISITEINLDCRSYLIFYITIAVSGSLVLCLIIIVVIIYRWHIRYMLFICCNRRRRYQPLVHVLEEDDEEENPVNINRLRYDVFVSYAHDSDTDLEWVLNDLRPNLEEGVEPFRLCIGHARDFVPGTPLLEAISEAIHNSRKTLVILSPSYLESEWCYFETQHAWLRLLNEGQDVLILVLLKPIPDDKMTMWLRQFLCKKGYLRWPKDRAGQELFWRCLRELIKTKTAVDRRYDV